MKMFPRLPAWFWLPAGLWETTAGVLLVVGDTTTGSNTTTNTNTGIILAMILLGGGLFATIQLKDDNGHTILSGRSALGKAGYVPPLIGLVFSGAISYVGTATNTTNSTGAEEASLSLSVLGVCYAIGYAFGIFCEHCGGSSSCSGSGSGSENSVEMTKKSL